MFSQLLTAVKYAHDLLIVHRDIKCDNILLDHEGNVKLADWGFSMRFNPNAQTNESLGSLFYACPEMFTGAPYVGPEVDVWSLGVVLYTLVTGTLPFRGESDKDTAKLILRGAYFTPRHVSPNCSALITSCLVVSPQYRCTLATMLSHPWLSAEYEHTALVADVRIRRSSEGAEAMAMAGTGMADARVTRTRKNSFLQTFGESVRYALSPQRNAQSPSEPHKKTPPHSPGVPQRQAPSEPHKETPPRSPGVGVAHRKHTFST